MTTLKIYRCPTIYRGQQLFLKTCSTSLKEAAERFSTTANHLRQYGGKGLPIAEPFDGVLGKFDSGRLREKYPSEINKDYPYEELKQMVDEIINPQWKKIQQQSRV